MPEGLKRGWVPDFRSLARQEIIAKPGGRLGSIIPPKAYEDS
jgi:hypothetical protein